MTAAEIIAQVTSLPPASPAALRLIGLLGRNSTNNEDLTKIIRYDSVLTAKLLRACNSPAYGLKEPVASVDQAALLLGHQEILRIMLALAFGSQMSVALPGYAVGANELWRHSLITAITAEVIVDDSSILSMEPSVAFTAGLLHDLGKVVLGQFITSEIRQQIHELVSSGDVSLVEAELQVIGSDHAQVGALLLESWKLPPEIVEAVAHHHQPILKPRPGLSAVTHLADCLAHLAGSAPGLDSYSVRVANQVNTACGITREKLEFLLLSARESAEHANQLMSLS